MKFNDIKSLANGGTVSQYCALVTRVHKRHYDDLARLGVLRPTTPTQVRRFARYGCRLDVLAYPDAVAIEELMNKHGYEGEYQYTKSHYWVRLINVSDYANALSIEYLK